MRGQRLLLRLCGLAVLAVVLLVRVSAATEPSWRWYEVDARDNVKVNLFVFWSSRCGHCPRALAFVADLQRRHDWLNVTYYETSEYPANRDLYQRMATSLGRTAGQVPALFFCKQLEIGFDSAETTGSRIERALVRWHDALERYYKKRPGAEVQDRGTLVVLTALVSAKGSDFEPAEGPDLPIDLPEEEPTVRVPLWGNVEASQLSLPALTMVLAGCDAFNPCAFFVLLFLLSLLLHSHSRWRMLLVGGTFVFFSALVYFLFMAAWLNLFFVIGHLRAITLTAGLVAMGVAVVNVKDFFSFKQGVSLSIPESVKPGLYQRMTRLIREATLGRLLVGTVALASLVNLYELLCTSGFPMVYTRVLTLRQLSMSTYYLYLVLYNGIYVLPLALIVLAFGLTLGGHKLTEYEGRVLKLLSGLMMFGLGAALLISPEVLNSALGATALLVATVALTALIVVAERWRARSSSASER
jgi:hypothetical protein